jgi:signal transduction histidine kinase
MFGLGCAVGVIGATLAARWQIRRSLVRVRSAERRARAAERLAEIGAMTGGLAHEIKNPLSTIGLNAQLLAEALDELPSDRGPEPEARSRMTRRLGSLRREVERLRGILTDFLEYAGEMRLDLRRHDVNLVVEELIDFLLPQAETNGIRIRAELAPGPLEATLDVGHLKQAILNLMLNAIQAMSQPGALPAEAPRDLILRTERFSERLLGHAVEQFVRIHVIDTGPGITPEAKARLFTPYFTTKAGGTGLGLPTTRRIVESHHGRIEPHSEVGKGTDFVITLPIEQPAPVTNVEPPTAT